MSKTLRMTPSQPKAPGVVKAGATKQRIQVKPINTQIRPKELAAARKSETSSVEKLNSNEVSVRFYAADEEVVPVFNRLDLQTISDQVTGMTTNRRLPTSRLAGSSLSEFMPEPVNHENRTTRMHMILDRRGSFDTDQNEIFEQAQTARVNALRELQDPRNILEEHPVEEHK